VHVCVLDEDDRFAPHAANLRGAGAGADAPPAVPSADASPGEDEGADDDEDDDDPLLPPAGMDDPLGLPLRGRSYAAAPSRAGARLLPVIHIESEIGQAEGHLLKNVSRVERFVQDVIRRTLEDELVFPNFHTIILGDG
jgi:distribution and morphology protein 12